MEYDEIRITTRREIGICREKIRKLERDFASLEGEDRRRECSQALARWRERLEGHLQNMNL